MEYIIARMWSSSEYFFPFFRSSISDMIAVSQTSPLVCRYSRSTKIYSYLFSSPFHILWQSFLFIGRLRNDFQAICFFVVFRHNNIAKKISVSPVVISCQRFLPLFMVRMVYRLHSTAIIFSGLTISNLWSVGGFPILIFPSRRNVLSYWFWNHPCTFF